MPNSSDNHLASFIAIFTLAVLAGSIYTGYAQTCIYGFQCLNCTSSQACVDGVPSGPVLTCPPNYFCSNTSIVECSPGTCPTQFVCSAEGRFADPTDATKYYICIRNASSPNGLSSLSATCPSGSVFNQYTKLCTSIATTTVPTTTTPAPYVCTSVGRHPDVRNCSNYYMCQVNPAGGFYNYKYTCPTTTLFSPSIRKCIAAANSGCTPVT